MATAIVGKSSQSSALTNDRDPELDSMVDSAMNDIDQQWQTKKEEVRANLHAEMRIKTPNATAERSPCCKVMMVSCATITALGILLCQLPCRLSNCCKSKKKD